MFEGLLQEGNGLLVLTRGGERLAVLKHGRRVFRGKTSCGSELEKPPRVVLRLQREAEVEVGASGLRLQIDGRGELLLGFGPVFLLGFEGAQIVMQACIVGRSFYGCFELNLGGFGLARGREGSRVGRRNRGRKILLLELQGGFHLGEEGERFGGFAGDLVGDRQVCGGGQVTFVQGQRGFELADCRFATALVQQRSTEPAMALPVPRDKADNLREVSFRGLCITGRERGGACLVGGFDLLESRG